MTQSQALRARIAKHQLATRARGQEDPQGEPQFDFLIALLRALDASEPGVASGAYLTAEQAVATARALRLAPSEIDAVRLAALLCNVGMIGLPDTLSRKASGLSEEERQQIQQHPVRGAMLLATLPALRPILPLVLHHHENWSGDGYPGGLRGQAIPLGARIIRVVDTYRALVSPRPYRPAYGAEEALRLIANGAGSHFDPQVVDAFVRQLHSPAIRDVLLARWFDPEREAAAWSLVQGAKVRPAASRAS